jgi:glycine C-acetyltransferase
MLYDAVLSQKISKRLLELGIYVIGFYYPVVPKGQARVRVQISAIHEKEHLDQAIEAFITAGRELGIIE